MKLNTEEVNSAPPAATHKIGRAKLNNAKTCLLAKIRRRNKMAMTILKSMCKPIREKLAQD